MWLRQILFRQKWVNTTENDVSECTHDTKHNGQMEKVSPIINVNYVKYLNILTSRLHRQIEIEPVGQREEGEDEG